jgi:hypothetical protein
MTGLSLSRRAALAALSGVAITAAQPAFAIEAQPMPLDHLGFKAAPPVEGALDWTLLGTTQPYEKEIDGFTWLLPRFPAKVKALNGQRVKINGFMMPLEETANQSRFLLMAYPPSCPYCLDVGPQYFMEVMAAKPVKVTYDAVLIEGRLELLEKDDNGLFFRLREARKA